MRLERIITLANSKVEIPFRVMERSLRATGCQLPLWVIPYDDDRFSLPTGSAWWAYEPIIDWTTKTKMSRTMRKYQCLTVGGFQFVDSDVVFLRNPEEALANVDGFITSCGHWRDPSHTVTPQSVRIFEHRTTSWPQSVFNSGQFACDRPLYTSDKLIETASHPDNLATVVRFPHHEQPGLNLLVYLSQVPVINLTLPPLRMESTWAGDYFEDYRRYWTSDARTPYLIHWAGQKPNGDRSIDELFFRHLTTDEASTWKKNLAIAPRRKVGSVRGILRRVKRAAGVLLYGG